MEQEGDELVCRHCRDQCWVEGEHCQERKEHKNRTVNDCLDGFFVRLLILDDIKESKKNGFDKTPQTLTTPLAEEKSLSSKQRVRPDIQDRSGCGRCGMAVYAAEMKSTAGGSFHSLCFTCFSCHTPLDAGNVVHGEGGEIHCSNCYKNKCSSLFSHPLGAGKTTTILANEGDGDRCPRCLGRVFQAERVLAARAVYHKACFRCSEIECGRGLDSSTYCDTHQGLVYCHTCYKKLPENTNTAAPTSRPGSSASASGRQSSSSPSCPSCLCPVFAAERVYVGCHQWHKTCLSCCTCSRLLDSITLNDMGEGMTVYCKKCYKLAMKTKEGRRREVRQGRAGIM